MAATTTAVLDLDSIQVEDGFNPRQEFDEKDLEELVASIRQNGLTSAITVRPNGGSHYVLVAGERRLIAARRAGLKQVPALIREGEGALAAAIAENLIRADLNPVEEGRALKRLAELEKLPTQKKLAERVGKSVAFVSQRLRLIALPEGCHAAIAAGKVPVEAERNLRAVAKVSPRVAECACELVARGELSGREIVTAFGDVLVAVSRARFEQPPTMIDPRSVALGDVFDDKEKLAALVDAYRKLRPWITGDAVVISLAEAEIDAARAARCLIELENDHGGWSSALRFLTDRELAADLAQRALARMEKRAEKRGQEHAGAGAGLTSAPTAEQEKAARAERRAEARRAKAVAERFNEGVGARLMERRGAKARKEHGVARAKAVAAVLLADHDGLAGRGLRLVLPQLREVEHKTLKSGEPRQKVTYIDQAAANEYLLKKVEEARTEGQVLEILTEAMIAAALADEAAVAQSARVHWYSPGRARAEELLAAEIKAARPRRARASR